jgi:TolB-like protein/Tfp pilus assembly protein PilF/tRNA A-37 threonylcarbamoyl transferase component Bud32
VIGETLSHFKITSKLGEGGMGVVWGADDVDLHRPVALKVLSSETLERADMRARFMREARTAAALNHPSICTIYEVGEVDEVPFIAMERIDGKGLDARLSESDPLALKELVRIAVKVAEGLAAAHGQGIVHRDLKPGNVMLTEDGLVKILDFGLAKPQGPLFGGEDDATLAATITAEMTQEGTILGTVAYMSPEQAQGKTVDSRSDVFSFGVLLYQMATGKMPFRGETTTSTLAKILERDPQAPSLVRAGLPADLERIILRCLAKDPSSRYNDTRDLVADLRSLETTEESQAVTSAATPAVAPVPAPAPAGKSKRWIGLLALLLPIAAILFFVGKTWFGGPEDALAPPPVAEVAEVPSVAVLPFHNMSADAENDYFSEGMTEEIISKLSRIDGLEVASRSSVAPFTDRARDVQQIGSELGVRFLLDGSVRRAGDQIRVSAQLVDGETGRNVWSEDFDGSLEDIFAMQEQTALKIAERLNLELSPEEQRDLEKRATENVAAYDAYLRGMALSREWGVRARLEQAIEHFEEALEHDPEYAAALAGLAFVESDMYRNFDTTEERIVKAEEYAQRAVELDPTMPDAPHALGLIAGNRFDYQRAAELLREAVRLAPKEARYWDNLSWALAYMTPPDGQASVDAAWEAIRLQPHFPGAYYHLGRGLLAMGRVEEARQAFETMIEQDPDFGARNIGMTQYYLAAGDYDEALATIERDAARDTIMVRYYRAATLAALGRTDEALEGLEDVFAMGFRDFVTLEASPYFAGLREDPRFQQLLSQHKD